jgi:hypothetical protein
LCQAVAHRTVRRVEIAPGDLVVIVAPDILIAASPLGRRLPSWRLARHLTHLVVDNRPVPVSAEITPPTSEGPPSRLNRRS